MIPASSDLYSQSEPPADITLTELLKIINKLKFIKSVKKAYHYSDEPKFFQFEAEMKNMRGETDGHLLDKKNAGGASFFSEDLALLKCVGESIERHSCTVYKESSLLYAKYSQLKKNALNPDDVVCFSEEQRKKFSQFNILSTSPFRWIEGISLYDTRKILIPAQLIFYNYSLAENEKFIYLPISTGAAGGSCAASAISRGIMEIVERDSFMIAYLNKLSCYKVDLSTINDYRIKYLGKLALKYRLNINVIDITSNLGIPTFACIIIDNSGIGSAVNVGLKSSLNAVDAIEGCIEEAMHARDWMRYIHETKKDTYMVDFPKQIIHIENRGMYWYDRKNIKQLDFWLKQKPKNLKKYNLEKYDEYGKILKYLSQTLKTKGYSVYYVDITIPEVKKTNYKVFKVVIPKLQPLYLDERFPYLGGIRLRTSLKKMKHNFKNNFNEVPHPFL